MTSITKKVVLTTILISSFSFAKEMKVNCSLKSKPMFESYCLQKEFEKGDYNNINTLLPSLYFDYQEELLKKDLKVLAKKNKLHLVKDLYSTKYKSFHNELLKRLDVNAIEEEIKFNYDALEKWYKKILESKNYNKYVEFAKLIKYTNIEKAYNLLKIANKHNNKEAAFELSSNKYSKYISNKEANKLLEKAGRLGHYEALVKLYDKDKKWIKNIKKLDENNLLSFYEKYQNDLSLKNRKFILKKLLKLGNTKAILIKLDSINIHKHSYNEAIKELTKKYPYSKFVEKTPRSAYPEVRRDILNEYYQQNNIDAILSKSFYSTKAEDYILARDKNNELYKLAETFAKRYSTKDEAIKICEKLAKRGYEPAKNLLLSLYLKKRYYENKSKKEKLDKLVNELAKDNNIEALYFLTKKNRIKKEDFTNAMFIKSFKLITKMEKLHFYPIVREKYEMYGYILRKKQELPIYKEIVNIVKKESKNGNKDAKDLLYFVK